MYQFNGDGKIPLISCNMYLTRRIGMATRDAIISHVHVGDCYVCPIQDIETEIGFKNVNVPCSSTLQ